MITLGTFLVILSFLLLVRRYHSQREHRELSTVLALRGSPESKSPIYDACKIFGRFIISRDDYSKGPFYLFIGPYFDYTLAPSTSDCVFALRRTPEGIQFLGFAALITHLLGTAAGSVFIHALISSTMGLACLLQRDIKVLLNYISGQLGVDSGGYKDGLLQSKYPGHAIAQARAQDIFKDAEGEITITTTGFGEIRFDRLLLGARIKGAGTLGSFRATIFTKSSQGYSIY